MSDNSSKKVKRIPASKALQQKVGTGVIDEEKIRSAEKVIRENKVEFAPLAQPYMDELKQAIKRSREGVGTSKEIMESFTVPIMNLKANAATFNYQGVTKLTEVVLNFLDHVGPEKNMSGITDIVDVLYKTVMIVIAQQISGDGGKQGGDLHVAFQALCQHYLKNRK